MNFLWRLRLVALLVVLAQGVLAGADGTGKSGLHIPQGRQVGFTTYLNDGAGYKWDVQYYLNIGQGTNYVYSGGLYCRVQGSNVSSNGRGWMNAAGDEIQIGPYQRSNCNVYRRLKVYRDQGLARWLDIFVNNSNTPQNLPVEIRTSLNGGIQRVLSSSGGASFGPKDWAFISEHGSGRPALLHIVCSARSKIRPTVSASGNTILYNYSVALPPGGTAVLCYFESQGRTLAELDKRLKGFRPAKALADLSPEVRKMIINFQAGSGLELVELERSGTADAIILKNGDSIFGRITNEQFALEAFYGSLDLPAQQVIGFASVPGQEELVHAVLAGGQVVTGKLREGALSFALPTGGSLNIPFSRIKQCSYRISKDKPEECPMTDPLIMLRTGDRLAFDVAALNCTFRTRLGTIALDGRALMQIHLHGESHGMYRAVFLNGSKLAGLLGPEKIVLPLKLGPKLDIPRDMVQRIYFSPELQEDPKLTRASLSNEDELYGRLADEQYDVVTDFGTVTIKPKNVVAMSFDRADPTRAAIKLWDGSTIRGRIRQDALRFQLQPGPEVNLYVGHIVELECQEAMPPDEIVKQVQKLVAMLSAASYKDREEAQQALSRMGAKIAPLLKRHLKDSDPEVRQRIQVILERLGVNPGDASSTGSPGGPVMPMRAVFTK